MKKILFYLFILFGFLIMQNVFAWQFHIPWWDQHIEKVSAQLTSWTDIVWTINYHWFKILSILKLIVWWLLFIFIVYAGAQMIWSMWENEEDLSKAKRQLWYAIAWLLFINIPWTIYQSFHKPSYSTVWNPTWQSGFENSSWEWNLFFDFVNFGYTFWDQVVWFLEVMIMAIAIVIIIYEALKLITSRWREERVTEARNKIVYSSLALIFVWMIAAWKHFAFSWVVSEATSIFGSLADVALFFAWPTAFFFLTLAWYYYLTSAWDEEKIKKAKSIIINTIFAVIILLAAYSFLLDLADL